MLFRIDFFAAGFDVLDEVAHDALVCLFFEFLLDLVAGDRAGFAADRFAAAFDATALAFRVDVLPVFLRVFLDIRLPFVAFRGSIIEVLRLAGSSRSPGGQFSFPDYAQKDFETPPARSL